MSKTRTTYTPRELLLLVALWDVDATDAASAVTLAKLNSVTVVALNAIEPTLGRLHARDLVAQVADGRFHLTRVGHRTARRMAAWVV